MSRKAIDFDETLFELLRDPLEAAAYLNEQLEFKGKDRSVLFLKALKKIALAQGMSRVAAKTKLNRRSLEKALSEEGNPRFSTLDSVLEAIGLRVAVDIRQNKKAS